MAYYRNTGGYRPRRSSKPTMSSIQRQLTAIQRKLSGNGNGYGYRAAGSLNGRFGNRYQQRKRYNSNRRNYNGYRRGY